MYGLGVTRQSLIQVVLCCCKRNELIVYFFDFLFEFIGMFLGFFNFVGEIPCGCWTISKTLMGVVAGSFEAEFGGKQGMWVGTVSDGQIGKACMGNGQDNGGMCLSVGLGCSNGDPTGGGVHNLFVQ